MGAPLLRRPLLIVSGSLYCFIPDKFEPSGFFSIHEKEEVFQTVFEHTSDKHEKLILHLPPNFYRDYMEWKRQRLYDAELGVVTGFVS